MNFFADIKKAAFAQKVFAAAGLDFDAAFAANDENALAQIIETAKSAAASADAELLAGLQSAVDEAIAENAGLETQLAALGTALADAGVKTEKAEDLSAALKERISVRARELVAATGGPVLADAPADTKGTATQTTKKTLNRADFAKLTVAEQAAFAREAAAGRALLTD